jgi:hypothetical protein
MGTRSSCTITASCGGEWGGVASIGMQEFCHRCGGELAAGSGESPFCPHCGAPQLYLSLENQSVETGGEQRNGATEIAAPADTTGAMPPPRPRQVEWKTAILCAAGVSGVAGLLTVVAIPLPKLSGLSTLWIMSGSLITLGLYQRRWPLARMDVGVGAKIGVVVGICLTLGLAVPMSVAGLVGRFGLHAMAGFDLQMAEQTQEAIRRSATPVPADMLGYFNSAEFRAGIMLAGAALLAVFLLVMSTLGGAFAGMMRTRRRAAI